MRERYGYMITVGIIILAIVALGILISFLY
jgi:hypothetical protein